MTTHVCFNWYLVKKQSSFKTGCGIYFCRECGAKWERITHPEDSSITKQILKNGVAQLQALPVSGKLRGAGK